MKTVQVERAQLEQWLQAFKKIHDDKHSHWDVDEEISAIEKALEPIAMDVMKSDEADFWRWWKPYQLKDCWRLELVARDAWMAAKATKQQTEQHARNAITWTPDTGYVFSQPKEPEQEPDVYIPADALRQLKGTSLLILRSVPLYGYRGDGLTPLYTTPPQRTWVGLTESDRRLINFQWQDGNGTATEIIDLVEAKLKEKNT